MKDGKLVYDEAFINSILDGEIDSYGNNCETTIEVDEITKGRNSFYSANEETIKSLVQSIVE